MATTETLVTPRLATRLTVALVATATGAGLVVAGPAAAAGTAANVSLTSTSADISTSEFVDATHQSSTDTPDRQFLSFSGNQTPPSVSIGSTSATGSSSEGVSVNTSSPAAFPVQAPDSISLRGGSSSTTTAVAGTATVPVASASGRFAAEFTTDGTVPVFFSGALQTANADVHDTCSFAEVSITGPVSRTFAARSGNTCTAGATASRRFGQSITLPAGSYVLNVVYSSTVDDNADDKEPLSLASSASVGLNLTFFPPTAAFTTSLSGSIAVFDASSSVAGAAGRPLTIWEWTFGDGMTVVTNQPFIKHAFPTSPSTAPSYRVTLQVGDSGLGLSDVASRAVLGTAVAFTVSRTSSSLQVAGVVRPNRAGHRVVVTLARKVGGVFSVLSTRRPTLSALSHFASTMPRPSAGTCRVRVSYPGDATHLAGLLQRTISC